MRLSLLLEREPFPAIAEATLTAFWSDHFGREIIVRWANNRWSAHHKEEQTWLVNPYLNAIFTPQARPDVFDPIRREFARSLVRWKRPLQRAYVHLAATRPTAGLLAPARLHVTPAIPQAETQLLVAGNHKIRWLKVDEGVAYGIGKAGFDDRFMRQEIAARRQAAACGLPVPELLTADAAGGWFAEQYVSGTPINRLAATTAAEAAVQQAMTALERLYAATATTATVAGYAGQLRQRIGDLIQPHHLLAAAEKETLSQLAERLYRPLAGDTTAWPLALTHGDFQPANILLNEGGVWLIDWEYAQPRQRDYDRLVFALQARFPAGLGPRLRRFVQAGWPEPWSTAWPPVATREAAISLFMLEELELQLSQINQPPLIRPGAGLTGWLTAGADWLAGQEEESFVQI